MSTNLLADTMFEPNDPRELAEQGYQAAMQALDPRALVEVALTQYLTQEASRFLDYATIFVRTGDTTGWMPSTSADGIGQELHRALEQAASQLLTQAEVGRGRR